MAYDKKQLKLLVGGISLLPPADLIDDLDSRDLSNMKTDQAGMLRSRAGSSNIHTGLGNAHSQLKSGSNLYVGGATALYRAGVSIATVYDGNPMGLVAWRGFVFAMNRNDPVGFTSAVKDSGSAVSRWIPALPAAAPVVTVGAEVKTDITTFDNTETWTGSSGLTVSFDAADKKEGTHSLKCVFTDAGVYTVQRTGLALNLNLVGGQTADDDDLFRIWVKVDDFKQIVAVNLVIDVSVGSTFDSDYYQVRLPRRKIRKAKGSWVLLEIRRLASDQDILLVDPDEVQTGFLRSIINAPIVDRESGEFGDLPIAARTAISQNTLAFERVGTTAGRDWSTVTGIRLEIEADGSTTCRFDDMDVFGSVSGRIEGKRIQFYYTYVTADGQESDHSPASTATKFKRRSADVALIASGEAQVTGIHVYRTGGTLGAVYRVTETAEANTTHSFIDTSKDSTVTALGLIMETDHDDPPAAAGLIGPFFGRLIAFSSAANLNRFWWSAVNRHHFPNADSATTGNWADIGDKNTAILQMTQHNRILYAYKADSIYRIVGDPDGQEGGIDKTQVKMGIVGARAVCVGDDGIYFVSQEGVYRFNGDSAVKISQKIDPIFKGVTTTLATGITVPGIDSTNKGLAAIEYIQGRLYVSYPASGSSSNDVMVVCDLATNRWYRDTRGYSSLYYDGSILRGGTNGGTVQQLETGTTDAGSNIAVIYHSKDIDCGIPDALKTFEDLIIEADTGGATLTVVVYRDNGTSTVTLPTSTISGSGRTVFRLQLDAEGEGVQARNIAVRITGSLSAEAVIYGIFLHYYPEARTANSFDTDEAALGGNGGVTITRGLRLDLENAGAVTARVYSDLPGNSMTVRDTLTYALGTGRRVISQPFTSNAQYSGFRHRVVLDGAGFQLYGAEIEYKVVGDYILANELWSSDELTLGSLKAKTIRALRVDLESAATVTIKIYSDLTSGTLALKDTLTISSTGGVRKVVHLPFTANAEYSGHIFEITATSTSDFILYGIAVEVKEIGTYITAGSGSRYDSGEIAFGGERVTLIKELQVDYDATAVVTLAYLTDLPGDSMASRYPFTLPLTTNRESFKVGMPSHVKGRRHQVRLTSTADFVLHALRGFIKQIGAPNASAWQWQEFPMTPTAQGIWQWQSTPTVRTGSNEWSWHRFEIDRVAG